MPMHPLKKLIITGLFWRSYTNLFSGSSFFRDTAYIRLSRHQLPTGRKYCHRTIKETDSTKFRPLQGRMWCRKSSMTEPAECISLWHQPPRFQLASCAPATDTISHKHPSQSIVWISLTITVKNFSLWHLPHRHIYTVLVGCMAQW